MLLSLPGVQPIKDLLVQRKRQALLSLSLSQTFSQQIRLL